MQCVSVSCGCAAPASLIASRRRLDGGCNGGRSAAQRTSACLSPSDVALHSRAAASAVSLSVPTLECGFDYRTVLSCVRVRRRLFVEWVVSARLSARQRLSVWFLFFFSCFCFCFCFFWRGHAARRLPRSCSSSAHTHMHGQQQPTQPTTHQAAGTQNRQAHGNARVTARTSISSKRTTG